MQRVHDFTNMTSCINVITVCGMVDDIDACRADHCIVHAGCSFSNNCDIVHAQSAAYHSCFAFERNGRCVPS